MKETLKRSYVLFMKMVRKVTSTSGSTQKKQRQTSKSTKTVRFPTLNKKERFPWETFPVFLEFMDGDDIRRCWFQCNEHLDKYLERYKLKKYYVDYKHGAPEPKPTRKPRTTKPKPKPKTLTTPLDKLFVDSPKPKKRTRKKTV